MEMDRSWTAGTQWGPFAHGSSLGDEGSELGVIALDEAHAAGARITLERDCMLAPFAVTCSVYGWMVHTRYFATEPEAQAAFEEMKPPLESITRLVPGRDDPQDEVKTLLLLGEVEAFVKRFPSK
jgi:hypothetical protein